MKPLLACLPSNGIKNIHGEDASGQKVGQEEEGHEWWLDNVGLWSGCGYTSAGMFWIDFPSSLL